MQEAWGITNLGIYSLKSNTGAGPGIWCHGFLPDYHSIKGSNGGYAFPLYDRRAGPDAHNINPALVAALAEAYGGAQTPEDIFDAILCLLSAQSYTYKFAEDLEDTFPHIPFPADPAVFDVRQKSAAKSGDWKRFSAIPHRHSGPRRSASWPPILTPAR